MEQMTTAPVYAVKFKGFNTDSDIGVKKEETGSSGLFTVAAGMLIIAGLFVAMSGFTAGLVTPFGAALAGNFAQALSLYSANLLGFVGPLFVSIGIAFDAFVGSVIALSFLTGAAEIGATLATAKTGVAGLSALAAAMPVWFWAQFTIGATISAAIVSAFVPTVATAMSTTALVASNVLIAMGIVTGMVGLYRS